MKEIKNRILTGERALFGATDLRISDCTFCDGESPLKECSELDITDTLFKWKYPLWYGRNIRVGDSTLYDGARAGIWYTDNIEFHDTVIQAPKTFRRASNNTINNVTLSNAAETLWSCKGVKMNNIFAKGDYFAMNSADMEIDGLILDGNYSFDGAKNVVIRNSKLITKDAFWNSENMTVYDSFISGEYLGWNSKNLTLVNCTIESLQGMCYIDNLKLVNCKFINTTLAFEYSSVDAEISSGVDSILNPKSGTIRAEHISNLIIEKDKIDPDKTIIICDRIGKRSDRPEWLEEKQ